MRFAVVSFITLGLGLGVSATPFGVMEERATASKCTTVASGYMVTSDNAIGFQEDAENPPRTPPFFHPFILNQNKEIAFSNTTTTPHIVAEFQKCTPNYYGWPNNGSLHDYNIKWFGRVYIPASKSCIGIENPTDDSMFRYFPKVVPCLNSAAGEMTSSNAPAQTFAYRNQNGRNLVFWSGISKINNKTFQGRCESQLLGYYQYVPSGIPVVGSNNRIQFVCNADSENAVAAFELK